MSGNATRLPAPTRDTTAFNPARFVTERARVNSTRTVGERLSDVYLGALTLLTLGAYAYGVALGIGAELTVGTAGLLSAPVLPDAARRITPAGVSWIVLLLVTALIISWCARFGPASLSRPQAVWWLPLPISRAPMLFPSVRGFFAACALVYVPVAVVASGLTSGWHLIVQLCAAVQGVVFVAALVGTATYLQSRGWRARTFRRISVLTALVAAAVSAALFVWPLPSQPALYESGQSGGVSTSAAPIWLQILPPLWPLFNPASSPVIAALAVVTVLACAVCAVWAFRTAFAHADEFSAAGLTARGGNRAQIFNAVYLLRFDELRSYREPDDASRRSPRIGVPFGILARLARRRWFRHLAPALAQTLAELTVYMRTPRILLALAALTPVPILVATMGPLGSLILVTATALGCGVAMAHLAIGPSSRLAISPALSALFPSSEALVKVRSALVASIAVVPFYVVMWLPLVIAAGRNPLLLVAAAMAGIGVAAASVRLALAPEVDLTQPAIPTPMGTVQRGLWRTVIHGNDAAVIAQIPLAVAYLLGLASPALFVIQALATLVAVFLAARRAT